MNRLELPQGIPDDYEIRDGVTTFWPASGEVFETTNHSSKSLHEYATTTEFTGSVFRYPVFTTYRNGIRHGLTRDYSKLLYYDYWYYQGEESMHDHILEKRDFEALERADLEKAIKEVL